MPKFAVYYIPRQEELFYRLGSSILGYDIRSGSSMELAEDTKTVIKDFDTNWTQLSRPYGLHVTIGPAVDFHFGDLHLIERELEDIIACMNPESPFKLQKNEAHFITFFGENQQSAVLRYDANDIFKMFHTLVIARINPIGIGTRELKGYLQNPDLPDAQRFVANRLLKFYYNGVLDQWLPHFTLLTPYTGDRHAELTDQLTQIFGEFTEFTIDSVCLMLQMNDDEPFQIYKEFDLIWRQ